MRPQGPVDRVLSTCPVESLSRFHLKFSMLLSQHARDHPTSVFAFSFLLSQVKLVWKANLKKKFPTKIQVLSVWRLCSQLMDMPSKNIKVTYHYWYCLKMTDWYVLKKINILQTENKMVKTKKFKSARSTSTKRLQMGCVQRIYALHAPTRDLIWNIKPNPKHTNTACENNV